VTETSKASRRAIRWAKTSVLAFCLFAPSAWMLATVPPLWRDVDGYHQLTQDPLLSTFWGWGPAYGYLSKIPLWLTEQAQRLTGSGMTATAPIPGLTDAGIAALIITQHLALGIVALGFIRAITNVFWARIVVALVWASNALFYTFAHSIGSESLSVVLVILPITLSVRLTLSRGEPGWTEWYAFAVALWLCLLSRQINGLLIFLLPAAFLLSWIQLRWSISARSADAGKADRKRSLRHALVAAAIGIACVTMSSSLTQQLARKSRLRPHSRIGFTFLWRLQFLGTMAPATRDNLLHDIGRRVRSEEARKLLALLSQMHREEINPVSSFMPRAAAILYPNQSVIPWEKIDAALNEIAFAFLLPPRAELLQAATNDFAMARRMPVTEITDHLFEMTTYFFQHRDEMPGCAGLATFRDYNTESILQLPSRFPYFHLWRGLNYNHAILIWIANLLLLVVVGRWKKASIARTAGLGVALALIGTLMVAATCLLGEWLPRYALPMWQLLLLSCYFFVGQIADLVFNHSGEPGVAG
jgi:hypothetical protein